MFDRPANPLAMMVSAFPLAMIRVECSRCWRKGQYSRARFVRRYGEISMREMLDTVSMSCGHHPNSEHRVGRRDDPCGAFFPDLEKVRGTVQG